MSVRTGQKIKILALLDILRRESDEDHPISAAKIGELLARQGITAERKVIYDDIAKLTEYGYDIIHTRVPASGYYLASRDFELPEIYLLTDAVQAANFITVKKTRDLIGKLDSLLSREQAKKREKGIYIDSGRKCDNEEIYYNIDKLSEAISTSKKVELTYRVRAITDGRKIGFVEKQHKISPYALIWQNDHYYLVGNHEKYDNLMHIRVDRMKRVAVTDETTRHFSEVSQYTDRFDIADYAMHSFNMYAGELVEVTLDCDEKALEQIVDRFGENIFITDRENGRFTFRAKALLSKGLVDWLLQFYPDVRVKSPQKLKDMLKQRIDKLKEIL